MWLSEHEGAKFWLAVLTELQNRGVKDIFIACVEGLTGFVSRDPERLSPAPCAVVYGSPGESIRCATSRTSTCKPWRQI